jgi:hypothetical protein
MGNEYDIGIPSKVAKTVVIINHNPLTLIKCIKSRRFCLVIFSLQSTSGKDDTCGYPQLFPDTHSENAVRMFLPYAQFLHSEMVSLSFYNLLYGSVIRRVYLSRLSS